MFEKLIQSTFINSVAVNSLADASPTFIFIDGSYFCFYRFYSLMNWWKNANPDEPIENPFQNEIFVNKFRKTFIENVKQLPKKLHLDKIITPIIIVGKDCKEKIFGETNSFQNTRQIEKRKLWVLRFSKWHMKTNCFNRGSTNDYKASEIGSR